MLTRLQVPQWQLATGFTIIISSPSTSRTFILIVWGDTLCWNVCSNVHRPHPLTLLVRGDRWLVMVPAGDLAGGSLSHHQHQLCVIVLSKTQFTFTFYYILLLC